MVQLRFYQEGLPPVLSDGIHDIQYVISDREHYIIGSLNDPHWKIYPKNMYEIVRHQQPINYTFTDYQPDPNKEEYFFYMADDKAPILAYQRLLKEHFEVLHKYRHQINKEIITNKKKSEPDIKKIKKRVKELKDKIKEEEEEIKKLNQDFLKKDEDFERDKRALSRNDDLMQLFIIEQTQQQYKQMVNNTVNVRNTNILTYLKEIEKIEDDIGLMI